MENTILISILGICGLALFALGQYLKMLNVASTAKYTAIVKAKVVGLKDAGPLDRGKQVFYPTLRYTYEGQAYRASTHGKEFVSGTVKLGDVFSIFVNPKAPQNICLVKGGETASSIAAKILGGLMVVATLFMLAF